MKYINIKTLGPDEFQVWACKDGTETVVCREPGGRAFDFNRRAIGLRVGKRYKPTTMPPGSFTREEAISVAHTIGRYVFQLGDLVYAYAYLDNRRAPDDFFRTS